MSTLNVPFRPSDIPTGLVAYWKFNNDALDSSGKGYDLTGVNTPAYAVDDYWKSGEYSTDLVPASNHRFTRARNADLDLLNAFTIAFWMKADDITSVQVIDKDQAGNGYGVSLDASSKVILNLNNGARATSATAVVLGKWQHITCVYTQTDAQVFINGNLDISSAYSTDAADEAVDLTIGALGDGTLDWDGHLKDLAIWSVALTPIQIKSLALGVDLSKYAYRPNHVSTQPTHWWKMTEPSGVRYDSITGAGAIDLADSDTALSSGGYIEGIGANLNAEYFTAADDTDFDFGDGDFSIAMWWKPGSLTSQYLFSRNNTKFRAYVNGANLQDYMQETVAVLQNIPHGMTIGSWYHIVFRRLSGTVSFWVDGVNMGEAAGAQTISETGSDFLIGRSGTTDVTAGVSDFAIWKGYALLDAEIKSLACGLPIQRQGIAMYAKMNGADTANETSEIGGYTLTATGSTKPGTAEGRVGTSRTFTAGATDGCFIVGDADALDLTSDFGILGWCYPSDITSVTLLDKGIGETGATTGYGMDISATSKLQLYMANAVKSVSATSVTQNAWNFFSGVYDGATTKVYLNAVQEDSDAYATNLLGTAKDLYIGVQDDGTTNPYEGRQDELVLLGRYPRPEEIKAVYLKGLNGKEVVDSERWPGTLKVMWLT